MGATTFYTKAKGKNAEDAFSSAVRQAQHDHGHAGYTGTIAEKDEFTLIPLPEGIDAETYANQLINNNDPRVDNKWGPAGALKISDDEWLFFGWASE